MWAGQTPGRQGWRGADTSAVYLLERASGRVVRRIDGLPDLASDLQFSADDSALAILTVSGELLVADVASGTARSM